MNTSLDGLFIILFCCCQNYVVQNTLGSILTKKQSKIRDEKHKTKQ